MYGDLILAETSDMSFTPRNSIRRAPGEPPAELGLQSQGKWMHVRYWAHRNPTRGCVPTLFAHNRVSSYVIAVISMGSKSAEFRGFWHYANSA
jgi:hypothetical protein